MTSNLFPKSGDILVDDNLEQAAGGFLYFFDANTLIPRTVYRDAALSNAHSHPVDCNAYGRIPNIHIQYGSYRVRATTASGVLLYDIDNITNPEPATSGGGGGITVTADQVYQTGDVKTRLGEGAHDGFVRLNGRTIGKATSGATERANDDTEDLFEFLWNGFTQPASSSFGAFVSAGRGANAAADFAAGKTITLFDARGRVMVGSDTMGAAAANVTQITSATISTTSGSVTATVSSASSLAIGMFVESANITAGTTIADISGTTITLSAVATGTASGTAARFSFFRDAQIVGNTAGTNTHQIRLRELAAHNHGGQTTGASASLTYEKSAYSTVTFGQAAPQFNLSVATVNGSELVGSQSRTHAIASAGSDLPHNNLQPSMTITYYIKL
jgi:hypothetical protein